MKTIETKQITSKHISQFFRTRIKNKFNNYRVVAALASIPLLMLGLLLVSPSTPPVYCSNDDPQCEVLKDRITKPRNDEDKKRRYYFCEQMKDRKCSEYENLCGEKSGDASFSINFDLHGDWTCTAYCPASEGKKKENASIEHKNGQNTLTFKNEAGGTSPGKFIKANKVEATNWKWKPKKDSDVTEALTADIAPDGKKLTWSNGTVWVKQ